MNPTFSRLIAVFSIVCPSIGCIQVKSPTSIKSQGKNVNYLSLGPEIAVTDLSVKSIVSIHIPTRRIYRLEDLRLTGTVASISGPFNNTLLVVTIDPDGVYLLERVNGTWKLARDKDLRWVETLKEELSPVALRPDGNGVAFFSKGLREIVYSDNLSGTILNRTGVPGTSGSFLAWTPLGDGILYQTVDSNLSSRLTLFDLSLSRSRGEIEASVTSGRRTSASFNGAKSLMLESEQAQLRVSWENLRVIDTLKLERIRLDAELPSGKFLAQLITNSPPDKGCTMSVGSMSKAHLSLVIVDSGSRVEDCVVNFRNLYLQYSFGEGSGID